MTRPPDQFPTRVPPPRAESVGLAGRTPRAPLPPAVPSTLPTDAFALQAQLTRLEDQLALMQSQIRQSQKLASIGTTAAMLAHEFNNLFTPVVAYAQFALDRDDVEMMKKALVKVLDRAETLHQMSDRLIGLARQPDGAVRPVGLFDLARNAVACLGRDLDKDNIDLNIQIDPSLRVRANENQLLQVLFNLVINARQAMAGRPGRLTVDAAPTGDGHVEINVRDTGCGIPEENLYRVFEPFFTTRQHTDKPDQRGLGLGLTICRDIIEELDGRIDVSSTVGEGTTFTITLPQSDP